MSLCRDAFTAALVPDVACRLPVRVTHVHESTETSSVKKIVLLRGHLDSLPTAEAAKVEPDPIAEDSERRRIKITAQKRI